jgi:hypothetical protein
LTASTLYGHLLFGLSFARVQTTIARGKIILDNGAITHLDEHAIRAKCTERAKAIWSRIH